MKSKAGNIEKILELLEERYSGQVLNSAMKPLSVINSNYSSAQCTDRQVNR